MRINSKVIGGLNPCEDRWNNWASHYLDFDDDVSEFFKLPGISHKDKLWVVLRLVSNETKAVFALDCSFAAYAAYAANAAANAANAAAYAAYAAANAAAYAANAAANAANAAAYAAYAAAYAANAAANAAYDAANAAAYAAAYAAYDAKVAYEKEQENQLQALLYLIKGEES